MKGRIPEDLLAQIAGANDIAEVIAGYFPVKRAGTVYKALCPFHQEKTPSFVIYAQPDKQFFKCFGCGEKGNVFAFLMKKEQWTFREAVQFLADRAGIPLEQSREDEEQLSKRNRLLQAMEWACKEYQQLLFGPEGREGLEYFQSRKISRETMQKFRLGYAPGGNWILERGPRNGHGKEVMVECGLISERDNGGWRDKFYNRVIFPICDGRGQVLAFAGRVLGDGLPKYLNSPETPIYQKRFHLYAVNWAKESIGREDKAVIVEGYTDVIAAHQHGVQNVVATCGTALTPQQAQLLERYTKNVVLFFDSDDAGLRAADRALEVFLTEGMNVLSTSLPEGKDPCDFVNAKGGDAFRALVNSSADVLMHKLRLSLRDARDVVQKRSAITDTLQILAHVRDDVKASLYLQELTGLSGVSELVLRQEYSQLKKLGEKKGEPVEAKIKPERLGGKADPWIVSEEGLLQALIRRRELARVTEEEYGLDDFHDANHRRLFEILLNRPVPPETGSVQDLLLAVSDDLDLQDKLIQFSVAAGSIVDVRKWWEDCLARLGRMKVEESARRKLLESRDEGIKDEDLYEYQKKQMELRSNLESYQKNKKGLANT